jgi:hypothetical protein
VLSLAKEGAVSIGCCGRKQILSISLEMDRSGLLFYKGQNYHFYVLDNFAFTRDRLRIEKSCELKI